MSGISYTAPGGGNVMTTFSGTFTTAELNGGANSPLFPGIVTQIFLNVTANPTWAANKPRLFLYMDTAVGNNVEIDLVAFVADPFNQNYVPVEPFFAGLWYTQSYASSFLNVAPGAGGLVGTVINYTALCWIPS